jgi:hypothetical protein
MEDTTRHGNLGNGKINDHIYGNSERKDMRALMIDTHTQILIGGGWEIRIRSAKNITSEICSGPYKLGELPRERELVEEFPPFNDLLRYFF